MWECDDKVCCDGYYLTNPTTDAGSATFSKDFAQFPHVVFTIHVVELGSGFKVGFVSSPQDGGVPEKIQLLEVTGEGSVAGSHPSKFSVPSVLVITSVLCTFSFSTYFSTVHLQF